MLNQPPVFRLLGANLTHECLPALYEKNMLISTSLS